MKSYHQSEHYKMYMETEKLTDWVFWNSSSGLSSLACGNTLTLSRLLEFILILYKQINSQETLYDDDKWSSKSNYTAGHISSYISL